MTMNRLDLYGECNVSHAPMADFSAQCCAHCMNPECTRSQVGKSRFEQRTATWYDRLFAHVPRMVPDDERYGAIAGQKFLLVNPSISVSSDWVEVPAIPPVPAPQKAPNAPAVVPQEPPPPPLGEIPENPTAPAVGDDAKVPPKAPPPKAPQQLNTTVPRQQMLPGAPATPDQVVRPGARIKLT